MLYLASNIIYAAARIAGILGAPGRGLSPSESNDCLSALNALLDEWNVDPLKIYTQTINQFDLVPNQQKYTIGIDPEGLITADFNVARPDEITHANIITQINSGLPVRTPMELLTDDGWSAIQVQNVGSSIPQGMYNDGDSPLSNLYFWPFPNAMAKVELYTWKTAVQFQSIGDSFLLPTGYRKALEYNLAVDLCSRFKKFPIDALVLRIAAESLYNIESHNAPEPVMSCDEALLSAKKSSWSYLTGLPN